ncbi:MAG: HAD family phosphatase [Bacteroidota bacterium]|nr:HAD family phosphatase [Bacteroidota bacterium]
MQNIKNVILDLGGVILNIDLGQTEMALLELGINNLSDYLTRSSISSFFKEYETGKIDDAAFVSSIQSLSTKAITEEEVIRAWNALLLDFPAERIELLQKLKEKYRLFLLSNTNMIHYREFQQRIYSQTGGYLEDLFEKTYYSHTVGLSKPDVAIFHLVINENKLNPAETLFVDDTAANMTAAKEAGLQVSHIVPGTSILDIKW